MKDGASLFTILKTSHAMSSDRFYNMQGNGACRFHEIGVSG